MLCDLSSQLGDLVAVALIPARGGSKGIPRKNLREVNGVPLIVRAVRTALAAKQIQQVYVSTDDTEIAEAAAGAGASIVWRPPALGADKVATSDVLSHALLVIEQMPTVLCLVQCTAPLLTAGQIDGTINRLIETGADVAVAAAEFHGFVLRGTFEQRVYGVGWHWSDGVARRQEMQAQWVVAGSVWAYQTEYFLRTGKLYGENMVIYPVDERLDIDTLADLARAELILRDRENPPGPGGPHLKTKRAETGLVYSPD